MSELEQFERNLRRAGVLTFSMCIALAIVIMMTTDSFGWFLVQNILWGVAGMGVSWIFIPTLWRLIHRD